MRNQFFAVLIAVATVAGLSLAPVLVAETGTAPRTAWGDPDLQGVWTGITPTPLERPLKGAKVILTDEEAAAAIKEVERRYEASAGDPGRETGTYNAFWKEWGTPLKGRTSLIVDPPDGRLPPLTVEAQKRAAADPADEQRGADNPEDRSFAERCINWELFIAGSVNQHYEIVQALGYVAISQERLHDIRIIPLSAGPRLPQDVRQWVGDSRGHWEGNTLVVDTTNFTDKANFRGSSKNLHLIERFTRVGADTINYEATLDDPTTWTKPWTLSLPLTKDPEQQVFEYACHEGNYGLTGMLSGPRAQERAAAKKSTKGGTR